MSTHHALRRTLGRATLAPTIGLWPAFPAPAACCDSERRQLAWKGEGLRDAEGASGSRTSRLALAAARDCEQNYRLEGATMNLRRALLVGVFALAAAGAGRAQAQCGYGSVGYGYGWGGAWDVGRLYSVLEQNVPHFAAFPPVYYSMPVPRTYGYSPFAYPPGVMTPEVVEFAEPLAVENPYFSGASEVSTETEAAAQAPADRTTMAPASRPAGPQLILNPYFERATPSLAKR